MRKDNLMFSVLGLIVGLVIGFIGANSINKSAVAPQPVTATSGATAGPISPSGNPSLPPDHPPLGTTSGSQSPGATGAAIPQVSAAIEKAKAEPQNYEAQMTAADLYYQVQRFEEAAKIYETANKIKPNDMEPMIKAGNAYFDAEKYELAEKWYLQALTKEPKNTSVRTDLGLTYFLRSPRDVDSAIKQYKMSLEIDPNHEISLQNLSLAYGEKGDTANLEVTLEKLRKVNPNNPALQKAAQK
ncbi:hypothetical protein BH10ACI2_BH10ACI2_03100 [soil metagenome]